MNKLKGYRVMCNMTQDEMAKAIGISREGYNKKEKDDEFSVTEKLAIIAVLNAKGLDVKIQDIFFAN